MTSKALIDSVLAPGVENKAPTWGQRLFAHWYNRLVLTQMWEDPRVEIAGLDLKENDRVVCLASAGCTALSLMTQPLAKIHAVEINSAHLAVLDLKLQAIRHLPDYQALLKFSTQKNQRDHLKRYLRHIRPNLQPRSRYFWETRDFSITPRFHALKNHLHHIGVSNRILRFTIRTLFANPLSLAEFKQLQTLKSREQWFDQHIEPKLHSTWLNLICRVPFFLQMLGIPPLQWKKLSVKSAHAWLGPRLKQLFCALPYQENPYLWQALGTDEDFSSSACLPDYLSTAGYVQIKQRAHRLQMHHTSLTQFLENSPSQSLDVFVLSDVMDWLEPNQQIQLWRQILRCATPGARVICRSVCDESPIAGLGTSLSPREQDSWHTSISTQDEVNQQLSSMDRCGLLNHVFLYRIGVSN